MPYFFILFFHYLFWITQIFFHAIANLLFSIWTSASQGYTNWLGLSTQLLLTRACLAYAVKLFYAFMVVLMDDLWVATDTTSYLAVTHTFLLCGCFWQVDHVQLGLFYVIATWVPLQCPNRSSNLPIILSGLVPLQELWENTVGAPGKEKRNWNKTNSNSGKKKHKGEEKIKKGLPNNLSPLLLKINFNQPLKNQIWVKINFK